MKNHYESLLQRIAARAEEGKGMKLTPDSVERLRVMIEVAEVADFAALLDQDEAE